MDGSHSNVSNIHEDKRMARLKIIAASERTKAYGASGKGLAKEEEEEEARKVGW